MVMTGAREPQPKGVWLHRYATLAAFCTLVLIAAGALVTSNDAGLSIPTGLCRTANWCRH